MADNTGTAKPKPRRKKGNILFNLFLFLIDVALTLFLFVTPLFLGGAYVNFILPVYVFGVLYVIVRLLLTKAERTRTTDIMYLILRIIGITVTTVYIIVLSGFGNYFCWFYPVRKAVYIRGNFSDASYFSFLPDSIPSKADSYYMSFVPPTSAHDTPELIEINFLTDEAGIDEMRAAANSKGGMLCGEGEYVYQKTAGYCEEKGVDIKGAEIYGFDKGTNVAASYVVNADTGFCMVLWYC